MGNHSSQHSNSASFPKRLQTHLVTAYAVATSLMLSGDTSSLNQSFTRAPIRIIDRPSNNEIEWRKAMRPESAGILATDNILEMLQRRVNPMFDRAQLKEPLRHATQLKADHLLALNAQNKNSANGISSLAKYLKTKLPAPTKNEVLEQAQEDFRFVMNNVEILQFIHNLYGVNKLDCSEYSATVSACIAARAGSNNNAQKLLGLSIVGGVYFAPEDRNAPILHQWLEYNGHVIDPSLNRDFTFAIEPVPALHYVAHMRRTVWANEGMIYVSKDAIFYYLP